ncbi:MAG: FxLYD domain-containing protein [Candidatus Bathyarchaeia archaeon]
MKKIITAVILVALIVAAFSMLSAPTVKANTSEAKVLSYSWYVTPDSIIAEYVGDLVAVGEIQNVGTNVIGYVDVAGAAYNSSNTMVASATGIVYGNNLLPGQKAPFYLDFTPQNSVTQSQSWVPSVTNVTVLVAYVNDTTQTPYSGLSIAAGSTGIDIRGTYTASGTVQNTGDGAVGNVFVVTTFYNASGTVVAMNYSASYLSTSFSPGESASFTATPTDNTAQLSSEIANYSFLIQSSPLTTSPTPSPPPSATPTSSSTASTQPTKSPAPISSVLIYAGAAAVVVVVVVLVALLSLRRRNKNVQFEQPPPPPPPPPP